MAQGVIVADTDVHVIVQAQPIARKHGTWELDDVERRFRRLRGEGHGADEPDEGEHARAAGVQHERRVRTRYQE